MSRSLKYEDDEVNNRSTDTMTVLVVCSPVVKGSADSERTYARVVFPPADSLPTTLALKMTGDPRGKGTVNV